LPVGFALDQSSGLGLQIVRSLVVGELRGTIVLRPRLPQGTEAVVTIPEARLRTGSLRPG
jgi:signal transduction histidine kinase